MSNQMPANYYNRHDPDQHYEQHLFVPGAVQTAEFNELQSHMHDRLRGVADALFRDGDVVRDARIVVNADTGATTCESGAIYLRGAVRGVAPVTLTVPTSGVIAELGPGASQTVPSDIVKDFGSGVAGKPS